MRHCAPPRTDALVVPSPAAPAPVPHPEKLDAIKPAMQKFIDANDISGVGHGGRPQGRHRLTTRRSACATSPARLAMEKDTLFRIASMTKPITAIGIMILVDEGKLSPDDDVAKHLPEFTGQMLRPRRRTSRTTRPYRSRSRRGRSSSATCSRTPPASRNYPPGVNDVYASATARSRRRRWPRHFNRSSSSRARGGVTRTPASTRSAASSRSCPARATRSSSRSASSTHSG